MNDLQSAAGFVMASRARAELVGVNSKLAEISDSLRWQAQKEITEQHARDSLFEVKKALLGIAKSPLDSHAVHRLWELVAFWFESGRLLEKQFSALADKEYFLATVELAQDLLQRACAKLGAERVEDIDLYVLCCNQPIFAYPELYCYLRAKEWREEDEKKQGLLGKVFYALTTDSIAPQIQDVTRRLGYTEVMATRLSKLKEKVPSGTITTWVKEQLQEVAKKNFDSSLDCLKYICDLAAFLEGVGRRNGFDTHEQFVQTVRLEMQLRNVIFSKNAATPALQNGKVQKEAEQPVDSGASQSAASAIWLISGEDQSGPYNMGQVWELYQSAKLDLETQFWIEGMPEWRPVGELFDR